MQIGPYTLPNSLILAPMAGVTDRPFRRLCRDLGAGLLVSEMVTSDTRLWNSRKSRQRLDHSGEPGPVSVQIAGGEPAMLADAARANVDHGAQIIDINMGCPAKKVLKKAAGSALLKDEKLVERILTAVVAGVDVPVTLKIRTGWSPDTRNGVEIAKIAEGCGIRLLTVHGRTRECRFKGHAEYDTIAAIKNAVSIPIIANGDIDSPEKAAAVLYQTGVDGLMIGRSAQGRPWIFREIENYLATGEPLPGIDLKSRLDIIFSHLMKLHSFYGDVKGVWYARKHVAAYVKELSESREFMKHFNTLESPSEQLDSLYEYFARLDADIRQDQGAEAA